MCICVRVYLGVGGVKVCVTGKVSVSEKVCESFYTMSFECVYASDACEYRTFKEYECVSVCAYVLFCVYEL